MSTEERDILFAEMLGSSSWDRVIRLVEKLAEAHRRDLLTKREMDNAERQRHLGYIDALKDLLAKCYGGDPPESVSRIFK